MEKNSLSVKKLLNTFDRVAFILSLFLAIGLGAIYLYLVQNEPRENERWLAFREIFIAVSPEFISILFAFAFSYLIFRHVQEVRSENEIQLIANAIADQINNQNISQREIEGISVFRKDRSKLRPLGEILQNSTQDISLLAIQHDHIIHQYLGLLQEKAKTGCKIRILMLSPFGRDGSPNKTIKPFEARWEFFGLESRLITNYEALKEWIEKLPRHIKNNIQVRLYFDQPIGTYIIIFATVHLR